MDRANGNCRLMGIVALLCEPLSVQPATAIVSEIFSYRKPNERQSTLQQVRGDFYAAPALDLKGFV